MFGGLLAAFGASACCFGPLLLVALGAGGVWAGRMRALEAFAPVFMLAAGALLGAAFWLLYVSPERCSPGDVCAAPAVLRRQRNAFWVIAALAAAMLLFPVFVPFFLE
jgi:mercuric ion transport protein